MARVLDFNGHIVVSGTRERVSLSGNCLSPKTPFAGRIRNEDIRKDEIGSQYKKISGILKDRPRVMELEEILAVYAEKSKDEPDKNDIEKIREAYNFVRKSYDAKLRKDNSTPAFAHPTRVAYMVALIGGDVHYIIAAICHDLVEDYNIQPKELKVNFSDDAANAVMLLTSPRLNWIDEKEDIFRWVRVDNEPKLFFKLSKKCPAEKYERRFQLKFDIILNTIRFPRNVALMAYIVKMFDALDNLVTDAALASEKRLPRIALLGPHIRHLEVISPGLWGIFNRLLSERGYHSPHFEREKIKKKVVELPPREKLIGNSFDTFPAPGKYATVYSSESSLMGALNTGNYSGLIEVGLPRNGVSDEEMINRLSLAAGTAGLSIEIAVGKSLVPPTIEISEVIAAVKGISDIVSYQRFKKVLEELKL